MSTLIIAEAGVNHNGNLDSARRLVEVAAQAGADLVKFQTFNADRLATGNAVMAEYQIANTANKASQVEMLRELELGHESHKQLIMHCDSCGIGFFSTGFDIESIDLLVELGIELFKIPSGEITNLPYLRHIASHGKPVIISTGMATMEEIEAALSVLTANGTELEQITVLHCSTEYPTSPADVNLLAMCAIRDEFGVQVGYSDHTLGIEVAVAAVALGASVIEKHFTLDRKLPGPDHKASLEPDELAAMVTAIRNIELALGDGIKRPRPGELANIAVARKSVVAAGNIRKGETFTEENLAVKRPGSGISPMKWDELLGMQASRDFTHDELIEL